MSVTHATVVTGTNSTSYQVSKDPWNEAHAVADGTITEAMFGLTDLTTANASTARHGLVLKLPNDATLFYDGTGAYSAPTASPNIKQTEQDFGATAVSEATFTVVDADVSGSSQIIAQLAYVAPTDKAIEEVYMEQPMKIACAPGTGQFDMLVQTEGDVSDKFVFVYLVG